MTKNKEQRTLSLSHFSTFQLSTFQSDYSKVRFINKQYCAFGKPFSDRPVIAAENSTVTEIVLKTENRKSKTSKLQTANCKTENAELENSEN